MTTYVPIPNGDIDQDSPGTQPLFTALRDNPTAIAEGDTLAPVVAGTWVLLERQEPTTDVTAVTFATDISGYREVMVSCIGQGTGGSVNIDVEVRAGAGAWRTMSRVSNGGGISLFRFETKIVNVDNSDGTNLRWGLISGGCDGSGSFDRSDANAAIGAGGASAYYSSFTEAIDQVRVSGAIEGSTANARGVFKLYGLVGMTRDA